MQYRAVGNRCAVDISELHLPISNDRVLSILAVKKFKVLKIDIVALARQCIGVSQYHRGARLSEAPAIVDCSSFVKWLYGQRGIWLPRRSIQQRELGEVVELDEVIAGDIIFTSGRTNYYFDDPADGVGHLGIVTDDNTVIHAASRRYGIVETPLDKFVSKTNFRGARRYIPKYREVLTFEGPIDREIEFADDIRWVILQSLPKMKKL